MDPQLDARLKTIEQKLDQTLQILTSMRRAQRTASVMRWLYWLVIIGLGLVSLYFIQPYLEQFGSAYGMLNGNEGAESSGGYGELLEQFKTLQSDQ